MFPFVFYFFTTPVIFDVQPAIPLQQFFICHAVNTKQLNKPLPNCSFSRFFLKLFADFKQTTTLKRNRFLEEIPWGIH